MIERHHASAWEFCTFVNCEVCTPNPTIAFFQKKIDDNQRQERASRRRGSEGESEDQEP